jgi:hypothetical protein
MLSCVIVRVRVTLRLTVSQSVGLSWCRTPSGAYDQKLFIYFSFRTITVFYMWAPSLTRGRVCRLSVSPLCDVFVRIIYNIFTKYIIALLLQTVLFITSRHGLRRKRHCSIVTLMSVATEMCLPNRCLETGCITPSFYFRVRICFRALPSNGHCL